MRVLYLTNAIGADYMADMLFHGLRTVLGADCVDVNKIEFMYRGWPHPPFYTVYALLPDIAVDRDDIVQKIQDKFFDAVIYGSIQRCQAHWDLVHALYDRGKIAFIDGEDDHVITAHVGQGLYFKRELVVDEPLILPIEFAIPAEKIWPIGRKHQELFAPCDPRFRETYKFYGNENAYYEQYARAFFGVTMKKGGWDCCRHYEIMAAGCLPYFFDLELCPPRTMAWLPKELLLRARKLADDTRIENPRENINFTNWAQLMQQVQGVLRQDLTTVALANRVLERLCP